MMQIKLTVVALLGCCLFSMYGLITYTGIEYSSFYTFQKEEGNSMSCKSKQNSIEKLYDVIQFWKKSTSPDCRHLYKGFARIFTIDKDSGTIMLPNTFKRKLKETYHFNDSLILAMKKQNITKVFNKVTHDSNMFNPFREKRPVTNTTAGDTAYVKKLTEETAKNCDFCQYKKYTAFDTFGRIVTDYTFTMANAFKYDRWHSMVVYKEHHPHNWSKAVFLDGFNTALKWINQVHVREPAYKHPIIVWDLMPHASSSQVHPHFHISLTKDKYYGTLEHWRWSSLNYQDTNKGRNYFTDLLHVHESLGLAVYHASAAAFASITPKRDHEFVVLAQKPNKDFFTLLYYVIRTYIDRMNKFCYSMAMILPPMLEDDNNSSIDSMPVFARIVTRGSVSEVRTDASSLELFAGSNVNVDPYKVVAELKKLMEDAKYQ